MTDDLISFLRARLDERETRIRNDIEWWFAPDVSLQVYDAEGGLIAGGCDYVAPFIDPKPLLADIEAKRRLIQMYEEGADGSYDYNGGYRDALEKVIAFLASKYSDHPAYLDEWRL